MYSSVQHFRGGFKLMIRRNTFVAEEHIEDFNRVRIILTSLKAPFSEKILKELLKEYNLVSNSLFIGELRKSGILQTKKKMLVFTDKPVHFNKLQEVYLQYQKKVNEYSRRARDKKSSKISEDENEDKKIMAAIEFLESKGFKVITFGRIIKD